MEREIIARNIARNNFSSVLSSFRFIQTIINCNFVPYTVTRTRSVTIKLYGRKCDDKRYGIILLVA